MCQLLCFRPDADIKQSKVSGSEALDYGAVTGLTGLGGREGGEDSDSESEGEGEEEEEREGEEKVKYVSSARPKNEDKDEKKERKKAIRDAKADKRKVKTPKHLKKRKEQANKAK